MAHNFTFCYFIGGHLDGYLLPVHKDSREEKTSHALYVEEFFVKDGVVHRYMRSENLNLVAAASRLYEVLSNK